MKICVSHIQSMDAKHAEVVGSCVSFSGEMRGQANQGCLMKYAGERFFVVVTLKDEGFR